MAQFVRIEKSYRIYSIITRFGNRYIVKGSENKVVYVCPSESAAIEWCQRH